nr:MAG TPA: hypothetical protein [Caudoviricetes sp.]
MRKCAIIWRYLKGTLASVPLCFKILRKRL